jgi:hypothetical protein
MPLVIVTRDPNRVEGLKLRALSDSLPGIVAKHLTCDDPDGKITSDDIEVKVQEYGQFDVHKKDLDIVIWAGRYPSRQANLGERRQSIEKDVSQILNGGTIAFGSPEDIRHGSVWILPIPDTSFGEF